MNDRLLNYKSFNEITSCIIMSPGFGSVWSCKYRVDKVYEFRDKETGDLFLHFQH